MAYRMPAEWEPHAATWVAWPHNPETWPGCLEQAQAEFAQLVAALAHSEPVHLLVRDAALRERVAKLTSTLPSADRIRLHTLETVDVWMRDIAPTFVHDQHGNVIALDWTFNAWGSKYDQWNRDDAVAARVAELCDVPCLRPGLIAEGGALEIDGQGTLLAVEATLLGATRNPGLDRTAVEQTLADLLGIRRVIWLAGSIEGDDTDGHIDDLARFVAPGRAVCARQPSPADPNHAPLEDLRARLLAARDARGRRLEVIDLPMPDPVVADGERLPASYANFYIANRAVLVPVFNVPQDQAALDILRPLFPTRELTPIPARTLVRGYGTVHCLTQQQPEPAR